MKTCNQKLKNSVLATTYFATSLLISSPTFAAKSCGNKSDTTSILECYDKDNSDKENQINNAIEKTKNKYPDYQFQRLVESQNLWKESNIAKCNAIFAGDGSLNRQNVISCVNDEWNKRLKIVKLDIRKVKAHKKTSFDFNSDEVMQLDAQINELATKFINKVPQLELSEATQKDKQQNYQYSLDKWKRFASNYCKFNGSGISCLTTLLKAKILSMQKDNELLVAE